MKVSRGELRFVVKSKRTMNGLDRSRLLRGHATMLDVSDPLLCRVRQVPLADGAAREIRDPRVEWHGRERGDCPPLRAQLPRRERKDGAGVQTRAQRKRHAAIRAQSRAN